MSDKSLKKETGTRGGKLAGIYGTAEWFITAISVTLVFIVFQMQAYTIPTGSMADTLKGAHFRLRCSQCAYGFDFNFHSNRYTDIGVPENKTPGGNVDIRPEAPRCPNCGFYQDITKKDIILTPGQIGLTPVMKGDRIFVAKCIYQFTDPKRWDVVVFKNPTGPRINYIKRMIGLPGEEIEIIDGDVYADGRIARKPQGVQQELWMCVYDNDYQPARPRQKRFNGHAWSQPFVNDINSNGEKSKWNLQSDEPTVFSLSSDPGEINNIVYDTSLGNDFKATYAYDPPHEYTYMPICSDLMVRFYVRKDAESVVGVDMSKYGKRYRGWVEPSGDMVVGYFDDDGKLLELGRESSGIAGDDSRVLLWFANVDHQLVLEYGDERLAYDLGDKPGSLGERKQLMPRVSIFGGGEIKLSHVGIFRDIHYIEQTQLRQRDGNIVGGTRAREGHPFKLYDDQFFVLGDNSPASLDSRYWATPGLGNGDTQYRMGTVPRDYLVGKAFFVYWPGPFRPSDKFIRIIPHVQGLKLIKGGVRTEKSE
ncbi:MAG: signal peptidase I [Planctomycetes bacterium]|nr:signal peptidase I [Planctomycetota bacterium]